MARPKRPNVVFVFPDQMRAQATGYAGDPNAYTPALDRLAAESLNVVSAVSGHPVCSPYRASLLTGQYPLTHGVYINDVPLKASGPYLAEVFAAQGYDTAYIGKWHLYGSPDGAYGRRRAYIPPEARKGFEYWKAFECNHDYLHSPYFEDNDPEPKFWEGYDVLAQARDACAYIREHAGASRPFLLILSWGPPHDPYDLVPEEYLSQYRGRELVLRPNVPAMCRGQAMESLRGYYAHIAALDDGVALLLETLDDVGIAEDTIFVFTSDHGDMHYSQGVRAKHCPWEESTRVPFLLRYPRRAGRQGREVNVPLNAPDIMPTLLSLCGLPIPDSVQGRDFSSELLGLNSPDLDLSAFLSSPVSFGMLRTQGLPCYRGVRTSRYTYVRSSRGPWLLYDNIADPYQMHNLCDDPSYAGVRGALEEELRVWLARLGDDFLPGKAYLERDRLTHYREVTCEWGRIRTPWTVAAPQ